MVQAEEGKVEAKKNEKEPGWKSRGGGANYKKNKKRRRIAARKKKAEMAMDEDRLQARAGTSHSKRSQQFLSFDVQLQIRHVAKSSADRIQRSV